MEFGLRFPSTQLALLVLAAMLAVDVIGLAIGGMTVAGDGVVAWFSSAVMVCLIFPACGLAVWRLKGDEARGAVLVRALCERVCLLSAGVLLIGAITTAGAIASYLMASLALPFRDEALASIDRAVGFDWLAVARSVCGIPWLESSLAFAYRSSMGQVMLLVPLLALTGQKQRLSEFVALFALTGGIVCVLSGLIPAEAAFFHFQPSVVCPHVPLDGTLDYHAHLLSLRAGTFGVFHFKAATGIVTFPSFHTALSVIIIYAIRRTRFLALPVTALNLAVIAATMPLGGHYLTDVVAGGLIAAASILVVRALNRRMPAEAAGAGRPVAAAA
jgi:membrane-associated phospholipid phosphatase